ncbi:phosphoribosylanthranilate isomerase [Brevundimonas aurifodinae]|uniref:N-(5'-phosphoribosyl)anthranilate isomerase n=2 Tax=Brevundimonas TaxID=41275 RepID=A0ABV1NIP4_9CAUL|nr:MAG: N-(5'-phosphoribosyl)anthranilate isomerase [Brevundimonas sp. 12-68-7]OYX35658.1 MAG: N-(5'-phosphoribosyl)anthranilate isomerase [Brevundimonas subvibrioides]
MTRVKICGLTTADTLDAALDHGAAFVGAVFFGKSPRDISPEDARPLFERARGRAKIVAVTVDADDDLLSRIGAHLRPDYIQLHGRETVQRAHQARTLTGAGIIRVLPVRDAGDLDAAADWEDHVDHLMFDARPPEGSDLPGGVGASFDWAMMQGRSFRRDWFLAGGLNPDNATQAAAISGAPLLDVSSGVESAPGVKDAARIAAFLKAVA